MYAWTDIIYSKNDEREVLPAGSEVSQNLLGVSDVEWNQLVESRAIRSTKYPDVPAGFTGSPKDFVLSERRKQLEELEDVDIYASDSTPIEVEVELDDQTELELEESEHERG